MGPGPEPVLVRGTCGRGEASVRAHRGPARGGGARADPPWLPNHGDGAQGVPVGGDLRKEDDEGNGRRTARARPLRRQPQRPDHMQGGAPAWDRARAPLTSLPASPPVRGHRNEPSPRSGPPRAAEGDRAHENRKPAQDPDQVAHPHRSEHGCGRLEVAHHERTHRPDPMNLVRDPQRPRRRLRWSILRSDPTLLRRAQRMSRYRALVPGRAARPLRRRRRGVLNHPPNPRPPTTTAPVRGQRARCQTRLHHDHRDHREHRGAGGHVRSLRAASALRQWGGNVRNRAALDQK